MGTPASRFLFVSRNALSVDCAWQCARNGNDVRYCIEEPRDADIGDGFVPKVTEWRPHVDWADVIVFDDVLGYGAIAHELRAQGKRVIGGTPYTDRLEDDRAFGQAAFAQHGLPTLPSFDFARFDDAITHVRRHPGRYVFKPNGESANAKQLLYVGQDDDGTDLIETLERYQREWGTTITSFELQEYAAGVEVAIGAFFNGTSFLMPVNINFEHKRLFPQERGPMTGEMGTSMTWADATRLFDLLLAPFAPTLAREGYVGYFDINCVVNETGVWPLEATTRFGYPTIEIQSDMLTVPLATFFTELAQGTVSRMPVRTEIGIGVRLVMPPYPFNDEAMFRASSRGARITNRTDSTAHVHIEDVRTEHGTWYVTGSVGVALIVTGTGATIADARRAAYDRINHIAIPNMYYREDIGARWDTDLRQLTAWGYLEHL